MGHTSGHGPRAPKIAWAMVSAKAIWGPGPTVHGLTCCPWACPMSCGRLARPMSYGMSPVLCPMALCPMALSLANVRSPCPMSHGPVPCPIALSYGPSQNFTSVVRCVQGQTLARCVPSFVSFNLVLSLHWLHWLLHWLHWFLHWLHWCLHWLPWFHWFLHPSQRPWPWKCPWP